MFIKILLCTGKGQWKIRNLDICKRFVSSFYFSCKQIIYCTTEMMTIHGDIFNCLGQPQDHTGPGLVFFQYSYHTWLKRHIPSPYIHIPEICLSVNHCVHVNVQCKFDVTYRYLASEFNMYAFLLVLWKCVETEEQVKRNELFSGRLEQDVS